MATSFTRDTRRDDLTATSQRWWTKGYPLGEFKIQSIQIHLITERAFPKNQPTINFFFLFLWQSWGWLMAVGFSVKHPAAEVLLFWVAMGPAAQVTIGDPGVDTFRGWTTKNHQKTIKKPSKTIGFSTRDSLHDPPGGFPYFPAGFGAYDLTGIHRDGAVRGWQLPTPTARCWNSTPQKLQLWDIHDIGVIFRDISWYIMISISSLSGSHFDLHGETRWWTNWFFLLRHFWTKKPSGPHWGLHHAWRLLPRLPPARCKRGGRGVLAPTWPRQFKGEIWRLDPNFHARFDVSGYWN